MKTADGIPFGRAYATRAMKTYLTAFALTLAFAFLAMMLPPDVNPYLASIVVLGLLLGPFGALGANTVSFLLNMLFGFPIELCLLDLLTTFIVSYLPYRMWYGTVAGGHAADPPSMGNVRDIAKLFLIMIVCSVLYMVLYNYSYGLMMTGYDLALTDLANLISVLTFSLIISMSLILLFKHRGVRLYRPRARFIRDDFRRRIDPRIFDVSLCLSIVVGLAAMLGVFGDKGPAIGLTYILAMVFLLKPLESDTMDLPAKTGRYDFDESIIERIILLFVVIGLALSILSGIGAYVGVLVDVLDIGRSLSMTFYIGATCLTFFAVALLFLHYIERRVSVPLNDISTAARGFVDGDEMSGEDTLREYERYQGYDSEIGVLARSLTDMTCAIEEFVEDIRNLNSAQERYMAELSMARSIQVSFIPKDFGSVEDMGVSVCGDMRAAKFVGGDLYDFFRVDGDHIAVAVADVSGKGMPAALLMAVTRSLLRSHIRPGSRPGEVLSVLNEAICDDNEQGMFVTAWLGILDVRTGEMAFANAGHCYPLVVRSGTAEVLRTKPGRVLGGRYGSEYGEESLTLGPGDRLVLYSDGVTEANDDYSGFYGLERLSAMAEKHADDPVDEEVRSIVDDVLEFTGESDQFDDITLFVLEYRGR